METIEAAGLTGTIVFDGEWISIDHDRRVKLGGVIGKMPGSKMSQRLVGLTQPKGTTRIHISDVTSVDFKASTSKIGTGHGYLGFSVVGTKSRVTHDGSSVTGLIGSHDRSHDENYVTFWKEHQAGFTAIRDAVDNARIAARSRPEATAAVPPQAVTSTADELRKLADLHREGLLTDEEFAAHKAKLL
ncbi:MAG: SHOCT domain-containing protein [Acidimicrobiales bacterium]